MTATFILAIVALILFVVALIPNVDSRLGFLAGILLSIAVALYGR